MNFRTRANGALDLHFLACKACALAFATTVRHDVDDAAYLARLSDYAAVFNLYRTKAGHNECIATPIGPRHGITPRIARRRTHCSTPQVRCVPPNSTSGNC